MSRLRSARSVPLAETCRESIPIVPGRLKIRVARPDDVERIAEVEAASFSIPWSAGAFRSLIGQAHVHMVVAELAPGGPEAPGARGPPEHAQIVGHGVLWRVADEAELANLAVDPSFRGQGVAGALLERLTDEASGAGVRRVFLEVRASNEAALALYIGRGFRQVGVRAHYYEQPREDAKVFRLNLAPHRREAR